MSSGATGVEFDVLGEMGARVGGRTVDLGHTRQRCVLAVLLTHVNEPVSVDQLIERVWADRRPLRAKETLYGYLHRLRQAVAGAGAPVIARRSGGYVLAVDRLAVDAHRFRHLVERARSTRDETLFDEALGLWRGDAFAGLDTPWLNESRDWLHAERLAAELDRDDLALRNGRHHEKLAELTRRAAALPLDERVAGQLVLALYRCGRQGDALAHYEAFRLRLAEELGADPGLALRQLHRKILTTDPAPPAPCQLPAPPWSFIGRVTELAELDKWIDDRDLPVIYAISGMGGVGKTWLALHWAHRHRHRFPDGQIYVDLHGFEPSGRPLPPAVALRSILSALGVPAETIPVGLDAMAALYRSTVADRRMLILVDNARDSEQVLPLLPATPGCTVLVTSRDQLVGLAALHGAQRLTLDVLPDVDARELLAGRLGRARTAAEPDAIGTIVERCAGLPLALGVVAARAANLPEFPLSALAGELRSEPTRLDPLDTGELSSGIRAAFAASVRALPPDAYHLFALLGRAPGPDVGRAAAANLTGQPDARVRESLRALETANLLRQHRPGRYRMHDLARLYAAEQPADDQALLRLVDFYLHTSFAGERLLEPSRPTIALQPAAPGCTPLEPADQAAALDWFDTERSCLLAAQQIALEHGWYDRTWQLAWAQATYYWRQGDPHDHVTAWRLGLAAAAHVAVPEVRVLCHRLAARAYVKVGELTEALDNLGRALTDARDVEDRAHTFQGLAWVKGQQGEDREAVAYAEEALRLYRELGNPVWEGNALNMMAWYLAHIDGERAWDYGEQALALLREHGDRGGEGATLDTLGHVARVNGRYDLAVDRFHQALLRYRELGDIADEADTLVRLGEAYHELGEPDRTRDAWQQAVARYRALNRIAQAERVQARVDGLPHR
ncbi:BTAD domain-containing putative transcriptional regulator [Planosporangium sp. 12N6]|uniref:AfsR/SARP family transcriptional regulator n=1 Tax=Planosporangium spinosum TaxID=3402278 RepID=UPI003CFB2CF6